MYDSHDFWMTTDWVQSAVPMATADAAGTHAASSVYSSNSWYQPQRRPLHPVETNFDRSPFNSHAVHQVWKPMLRSRTCRQYYEPNTRIVGIDLSTFYYSRSKRHISYNLHKVRAARWRNGKALELRSVGRGFNFTGTKLRNNLGQVVQTHVPLSPSSITWHWLKDSEVLWLRKRK